MIAHHRRGKSLFSCFLAGPHSFVVQSHAGRTYCNIIELLSLSLALDLSFSRTNFILEQRMEEDREAICTVISFFLCMFASCSLEQIIFALHILTSVWGRRCVCLITFFLPFLLKIRTHISPMYLAPCYPTLRSEHKTALTRTQRSVSVVIMLV